MTIDEKRELLHDVCDKQNSCSECPFSVGGWEYPLTTAPNSCLSIYSASESDLDRAIELANGVGCINTTPSESVDLVNHPPHYTHGGMECIDEMILIFGKKAVMNFCLCNAWKYRKRAAYKGTPEQDMEKSDWYLNKYKELKGDELPWHPV